MSEKNKVMEGCLMTCSMGSNESSLKVPTCHGACIGGKNQATIMDYKSGINVISFGTCKKTSPLHSCVPVILTPWLIEDKNDKINGEPALFSTSLLSCACGGIIRFRQPQ